MTNACTPVLTAFLLLVLSASAGLAGCGDASDPGSLRSGSSSSGTSTDAPATDPATDGGLVVDPGGSSGSSGSSGTSGTSGSSGSSGSDAGNDAGTDSGTPPPSDVFTGAPAYTNTAGRSTQNESHPNGGTAVGAACFSCHGKGVFSMVMGGTVYADAAGTAPAANAQVVLKVGATFFSANTNATGNFLVMGSAFSGTGKVGVRNGVAAHVMAGAVATGDCNSCHDGTVTSRIHLP